MEDWDSDTGERTPTKPAQILVPETPSPSCSRNHQNNGHLSVSPVFNSINRKPLFLNGFSRKCDNQVGSKPGNFKEAKKQSAFEKLRAIRQKKKSSSPNTTNPTSYNRSRPYSMWPSDSESDSDQDTLEAMLNKPSVEIGNTRLSSSSPSYNSVSQQKSEHSTITESGRSSSSHLTCKHISEDSPILPLRKRVKLQQHSESSGASILNINETNSGTPVKGKTARSDTKCKKKLTSSQITDFVSTSKRIDESYTESNCSPSSSSKYNNKMQTVSKADVKHSSGNRKGKQKLTKTHSGKGNHVIGHSIGLNGEIGAEFNGDISDDLNTDTPSLCGGLGKQNCTTQKHEANSGTDSGLHTSNFYKKSSGRARKGGTAGRDTKKTSTSRQKKNKSDRYQSERVTVDSGDDDAVMVVDQLETDESMARKLQEELDREFALSLAQTHSPHRPVPHNYHHAHSHYHPQGRVRSGPVASGFDMNMMTHDDSVANDETSEPFLYMPAGNWNQSPLALLTSHVAMWDGGNNWTTTVTRGRTRQARGGSRGRWGRRNAVVGLNSPGVNGEDYEALLNLAEHLGEAKPKGLSKSQINCLPVKKFVAGSGESTHNKECLVCMCEFENNDSVRILTCFHDFHAACIDKWLKKNNTCPICRVEVQLN